MSPGYHAGTRIPLANRVFARLHPSVFDLIRRFQCLPMIEDRDDLKCSQRSLYHPHCGEWRRMPQGTSNARHVSTLAPTGLLPHLRERNRILCARPVTPPLGQATPKKIYWNNRLLPARMAFFSQVWSFGGQNREPWKNAWPSAPPTAKPTPGAPFFTNMTVQLLIAKPLRWPATPAEAAAKGKPPMS